MTHKQSLTLALMIAVLMLMLGLITVAWPATGAPGPVATPTTYGAPGPNGGPP